MISFGYQVKYSGKINFSAYMYTSDETYQDNLFGSWFSIYNSYNLEGHFDIFLKFIQDNKLIIFLVTI